MENHVLSVIVGDDLVPRVSYQSMYKLKNKIDRELHSTSRAKYEVLLKGIFKLFFSTPWELHDNTSNEVETRDCRRLIEEGNSTNYGASSSSRQSEDIQILQDDQEGAVITESFRIQLFPPGKLAHLTAVDDSVEFKWIEPSYLSDIHLTGAIFSDHFPHRLRKIMKKALEQSSVVLTDVVTESQ